MIADISGAGRPTEKFCRGLEGSTLRFVFREINQRVTVRVIGIDVKIKSLPCLYLPVSDRIENPLYLQRSSSGCEAMNRRL